MNKFSKIVMGLKALLGQKAPSSAVTDIQLDWDNHQISLEDGEWWMAEVAAAKPMPKEWVGKVVFVPESDSPTEACPCGKDMIAGGAVCDDCLEDSEFLVPAVCKGCGKLDYKELLDFCFNCETDGTEFRVLSGESLSDAVDRQAKPPF